MEPKFGSLCGFLKIKHFTTIVSKFSSTKKYNHLHLMRHLFIQLMTFPLMTLTVTIILVLHKLIVIIHVMWIMSTLACFQLLRLHALSFSDILINHYHLFQGQLLCLKISSMLVWVFVGLIQKSIERLIDYELGYCFWS